MHRYSSLCLQGSGRIRSATARPVPSLSDSLCFLTHPPKLKKLVNQVVQELTLLGFSPEVVRNLVKQRDGVLHAMKENRSSDEHTAVVIRCHTTTDSGLRLSYEVDNNLGHMAPHLRLIVDKDINMDTAVSEAYARNTLILTQDTKPYVSILASLGNSLEDP